VCYSGELNIIVISSRQASKDLPPFASEKGQFRLNLQKETTVSKLDAQNSPITIGGGLVPAAKAPLYVKPKKEAVL
jgi:hypothetical protein